MYDKKIAYLHYIRNGELIANAGHVKITFRGKSMCMEIYVRDMRGIVSGYYYIKSLDDDSFEDKIHIEDGQAVYKKRFDVDKDEKFAPFHGLKIEISKGEYLEAVWDKGEEYYSEVRAAEKVQNRKKETEERKSAKEEEATKREEYERKTEQRDKGILEEADRRIDYKEQNKNVKLSEMLTFSVPTEVYEDKWNELCKRFATVHPFGNQEEYISISPKDFIIFPEKYQNLVNNSFLLHGYYNYQHIILGKKEEGGKAVYYLGVPGVYYEREKMVAIMFGFEGFECGDKRANNGGFGYYMRRVEL